MVQIKLTANIYIDHIIRKSGDVIEVDDNFAARLIQMNQARAYEAPKPKAKAKKDK